MLRLPLLELGVTVLVIVLRCPLVRTVDVSVLRLGLLELLDGIREDVDVEPDRVDELGVDEERVTVVVMVLGLIMALEM